MKADSFKIAKVFSQGGDIHYVLPHFQREYRWQRQHWQTLWEDALTTYEEMPENDLAAATPEHFLGALVVVPDGTAQATIPIHKLVDGQQRLTTISLFLRAFAEVVHTSHPGLARNARKLLLNSDAEGDLQLKVLPTTKNNDRDVYRAVIAGTPIPSNSNVYQAYEFFKKRLSKESETSEFDAAKIFQVITSAFQVVFIELDKNESAHQIFESLNNKGEKLRESDLVRNYIAMRLPIKEQERAFREEWLPVEELLSEERMVGRSSLGELTAFLRHYDALRTNVLPSEKTIYARFRDASKPLNDVDFLTSLREMRRYAGFYHELLHPETMDETAMTQSLQRLAALDISTAYPFLLAMRDEHERGVISTSQFAEACSHLENYLVRRFLVAEQTAYLNKMFASLTKFIDWENFTASLAKNLRERNYPSDERMRQTLVTRSLYDKAHSRERIVMILERIDDSLHAGSDVKTVLDGAATLEHILPQTPSAAWMEELGDELEETAREWKHTLGNLTLVTQSYNSSLSNDAFSDKKERLIEHGLRLNSEYFSQPITLWNAAAITERANWLIEQIIQIWPSLLPQNAAQSNNVGQPHKLVIETYEFSVASWRAVLRRVGDYLAEGDANFDLLSQQVPHMLAPQEFRFASHRLANDWYIYLNLSGKDSMKALTKLMTAAGISDWRVEVIGNN